MLSLNFTGTMGLNHVLNACGGILSSIKVRQFVQAEEAVIFIFKIGLY
jgi:hypothetical protein